MSNTLLLLIGTISIFLILIGLALRSIRGQIEGIGRDLSRLVQDRKQPAIERLDLELRGGTALGGFTRAADEDILSTFDLSDDIARTIDLFRKH